MRRRSDEELLAATGDDPDAFAVFYRRHAPRLEAWCARRTGDRELAADLVADTFAAALEGRHRFRSERGPAAAWLFGIARNQLARQAERGAVEAGARRRLGAERATTEDLAPERLAGLDAAPALRAALATLPDEQRRAIGERVVEERAYPEIAAGSGSSEAAVRQRVSRGLAALRRALIAAPVVLVALVAVAFVIVVGRERDGSSPGAGSEPVLADGPALQPGDVAVLNASGVQGRGEGLRAFLAAGHRIDAVGRTRDGAPPEQRTVVRFDRGGRRAASRLARDLLVPAEPLDAATRDAAPGAAVVVVVGADVRGVRKVALRTVRPSTARGRLAVLDLGERLHVSMEVDVPEGPVYAVWLRRPGGRRGAAMLGFIEDSRNGGRVDVRFALPADAPGSRLVISRERVPRGSDAPRLGREPTDPVLAGEVP